MKRKVTRWLSRTKKPLLAFCSTVLTLVVCELIVRLCGLVPPVKSIQLASGDAVYKRSSNPILGYELKANYRNVRGDPDSVNTNAHGQRDIEREIAKPPGVKRILVLGDSVTQGTGLNDLRDTIPWQLQQQLDAEADGRRVEVLNFGVDGYCTRSEIELLEVKGLAFDPDVVIVIFVENDFMNFNTDNNSLATQRPAVVNGLFVYSELFRLAALRWDLFGFRTEHDPVTANNLAIGDNNVADGLARLKQLADEHEFSTLLAIWPRFNNDSIVDVHEMPDSPGQLVVERLAHKNGIPFVRLSPFFEEHLASREDAMNPRVLYTIGDQMHPSPLGSQVAAKALKNTLANLDKYALDLPTNLEDASAVDAAKTISTQIKPTNFRATMNLANQLLDDGDLPRAAALYERARDLQPDRAEPYYSLGLVHERQNQIEQAWQDYQAALERDAFHLGSLYNLGLIHAKRGELEAAARLFEEAVRINPEHADSHHNLGVVYLNQRKWDKAVVKFKQTLQLSPRRADTRFSLKQALDGLNKVRSPADDATK